MTQPDATKQLPPVRPTAREVFDFSDRPARVVKRTSVLEWIGLFLAILVPPVGLLVTIVARIVTRYCHHWTTTVAKAATVISIVLTVLLAAGYAVYAVSAERDAAAARVVANAQPLCNALAETPGVLELDAYGWPTEIAPLTVTLDSMRAYQAHWLQLAEIAPESAKAGVTAIADQAALLISSVEGSQAIDRGKNLATMKAVTDVSGLPQYVDTYCG